MSDSIPKRDIRIEEVKLKLLTEDEAIEGASSLLRGFLNSPTEYVDAVLKMNVQAAAALVAYAAELRMRR